MQENTRRRTESDLQLWEITAPRQKTGRHNQQVSRQRTQMTRRTAPNTRSSGNTGTIRKVQSIKRRQAKRRRVLIYRCIALAVFMLFLVGIFKLTGMIYRSIHAWNQTNETTVKQQDIIQDTPKIESTIKKPQIMVNLLEENYYSRPGTKLKKINNVFVHYTANKGTSAQQNRSYFANLAETGERSASAHFIIGYEGEIIQCIPLDEEAYAVRGRNDDSVSIECCYLSDDGSFTPYTYDSLIELLAWLCDEYGLTADDILRHYDEGGKKCPLYYVEHEDEWNLLLEDVAEVLEADG